MQEAPLEGVDTHDDLSIMAEPLLNHQFVHNLLLDVDVAILQGHHHSHQMPAQSLAKNWTHTADTPWAATTCLHPKAR